MSWAMLAVLRPALSVPEPVPADSPTASAVWGGGSESRTRPRPLGRVGVASPRQGLPRSHSAGGFRTQIVVLPLMWQIFMERADPCRPVTKVPADTSDRVVGKTGAALPHRGGGPS